MIVLTTRKACREALEGVVRKLENWRKQEDRVQFVPTFAEAQREVQRMSSLSPDTLLLVIDLGTVAQERDLVKSVETVVAARPWLTTVALTSGRADETKALLALQQALLMRDRMFHHMDHHECADPASWKRLFRETFVDRIGAEIEADLIAAEMAARAAAGQPAKAIVFGEPELLSLAPTLKKVADLAKLKGVSGVTLWARYTRRYHHSPSELLGTFRCVWSRKLASMGRTQAQIADFLGQPDTAHHSRVVGTALGLKKSELNEYPYPQLVTFLGETVTKHVGQTIKEAAGEVLLKPLAVVVVLLLLASYGMRQVTTDRLVAEGAQHWEAARCGGCHRIQDVARVAAHQDANVVARWLVNPQAVRPSTVMPNEHLDPVTVTELVAFVRKSRS